MTASSASFGAMGYWRISAIPARTKTMPSEPCGRHSISLPPSRDWRRVPGSRSRSASASPPAWCWSATSAARVPCGGTRLSGGRRRGAERWGGVGGGGTVVVAVSTRRLLGDLFRLRDLGRHEVKGLAEPVAAWAVEGVSDSESRFEAVRVAELTDLIGREDEIDFLLERQRLAWKGEGQILLISGE